MAVTARKNLVDVLKKIPLFKDLSLPDIRRILGICASRTFEQEERICVGGLPSNEMYILIGGELAILTVEGMRVAMIVPVTTVGEMGFITGQPRSATVEAVKNSNVLVIQKEDFDSLIKSSSHIKTQIYQNIIGSLSDKLVKDNIRIRDYTIEIKRYDNRFEEQSRKFAMALELLEEKGLERSTAEALIDARLRENAARILLVDGEADSRTLLKSYLYAYQVLEASNGKDALTLTFEQEPDLVILDMGQPEMDGPTLLDHLRDLFPLLPVLATSGYAEIQELQQYNFDGLIEKPVAPEQLIQLIEATLNDH